MTSTQHSLLHRALSLQRNEREGSTPMPTRECSPCWPFCCEVMDTSGSRRSRFPSFTKMTSENERLDEELHPPPLCMDLIAEVQEEVWQKIEEKYAKYRDRSCSVDRAMDCDDDDDENEEAEQSELLRLFCDGVPSKKRLCQVLASIPIEVFVGIVLSILYFFLVPLDYVPNLSDATDKDDRTALLDIDDNGKCVVQQNSFLPSLFNRPSNTNDTTTPFSFPYAQFLMPIPACFMMSVLVCQMVANVCEVLRSGLLGLLVSPTVAIKRARARAVPQKTSRYDQ